MGSVYRIMVPMRDPLSNIWQQLIIRTVILDQIKRVEEENKRLQEQIDGLKLKKASARLEDAELRNKMLREELEGFSS
ncbi:hypothetical protein EJ08DRAFT_648057 [Tothia fuscella]|uniref:Uncharacterized protein n=1 Tax=Tothia fuscella TaxID=1048955 RepID=A0A9P4NVS4_9PEZI|nr:hypothetical protein EJ08DRAFT_648057 [Tothia fuscella]